MCDWCERVQRFRKSFNFDADEDWKKTARLKAQVAQFRADNPDQGLTRELFEEIVAWKLGRQGGRTRQHRSTITTPVLREITGCAFRLDHEDRCCLARMRMSVLQALPGVGMGIASAILALTFPNNYAVIDFRVWEVVYEEDREVFSESDYMKYLGEIVKCASILELPPQEVDFLAWKLYESEDNT